MENILSTYISNDTTCFDGIVATNIACKQKRHLVSTRKSGVLDPQLSDWYSQDFALALFDSET